MTPATIRLIAPDARHATGLLRVLQHPRLAGRRFLPYGITDRFDDGATNAPEVLEAWRTAEARRHYLVVDDTPATAEPGVASEPTVVGYAGANWTWDPHNPRVFVVIDPGRWRQGIGRQALEIVVGRLFAETVAHNVSCQVAAWNTEGSGFLEALGFRYGGRLRRAQLKDGQFYAEQHYDVLRREWLERSVSPRSELKSPWSFDAS
jgi:RimJ/RimL family protein N-acetyltransferase